MVRSHKIKRPKRTVALVGDGHAERIYFAGVRDTDRPKDLSIFPDYPRRIGSYKGVLERSVWLINNGYDRVYALIDMDKVIEENRMAEYQQAKQHAERSGIIVLENNPCFEIWILLHFQASGKLFLNCNEVISEIKRIKQVADYNKAEKFLASANLYEKYKDQLRNNAIPNAKRLEARRQDFSERYPRAETYRFFEWYFGNYQS